MQMLYLSAALIFSGTLVMSYPNKRQKSETCNGKANEAMACWLGVLTSLRTGIQSIKHESFKTAIELLSNIRNGKKRCKLITYEYGSCCNEEQDCSAWEEFEEVFNFTSREIGALYAEFMQEVAKAAQRVEDSGKFDEYEEYMKQVFG